MKLSIIIPAYNEEARLEPMLASYADYFTGRYGEDVELIVVVNGSIDHTEDIARGFERRFPQVRVIVEPKAIGKGGAILLGVKEARGEWIGFVDADGATPPETFQGLVAHVGEADVVIASRWIEGAVVDPPQPLKRRIASRIFNALVRWFFKLKISDTQCGAKLIRGEAMRAVRPRLGLTQWAFDVELLFKLRRAGCRIEEIPTTWRDIGGSQLRMVRASLEMFVAICRLRLLYSPLRWVVTVYDHTLGRIVHRNES